MSRIDWWETITSRATELGSSRWTFLAASLSIVVWGLLGPVFQYSDTWQLVANTGTTLVTYLLGFLILGAQQRGTKAIHLKIDELLRARPEADNALLDAEKLSEQELDRLSATYHALAEKKRAERKR
jgi:low affinity Fe/Cu permease